MADTAVDISRRSSADAREACRPVEPCIHRLCDFPSRLRRDGQLRSNLSDRYGPDLDAIRFRLLEVPLHLLAEHRVDDFDGHFESLIECDREYDTNMLRCDEEPEWPWHDGEERHAIACDYVSAFRAGLPVCPVVVDFDSMAELGAVDLIDGHHRTQAAHEAGAPTVQAYEVLNRRGRATRARRQGPAPRREPRAGE